MNARIISATTETMTEEPVNDANPEREAEDAANADALRRMASGEVQGDAAETDPDAESKPKPKSRPARGIDLWSRKHL